MIDAPSVFPRLHPLPELLMGISVVHVAATPLLLPGLKPLSSAGMVGGVADDAARESAVW